ncbi:MAG TPA: hypothetical protein VGS58_20515, partial [Candidatus Sulfopaludibacter sp.]|nr:hypothetical protein [Candidatus Sulfopaludibacter sp.]
MQFQALSPESLLFCASDGNGNTNLALLYLLPAGTASPPSTISFEESWSGQGTYLFLEQPLDTGQASAFADAAWNFLEAPHMVYTRFVWFNQPQPGAGLAGTNLAVYQPATGSYATAFQADFVFQNTSLIVAANTAIAPDLTNFAFVLTQTGGNSIYLSADWGMAPVNSLGATLTIPFTGSLAGCLQFSANLSLQNLADLDAGLRYYYAEVAGLEDPSQITQSFFLDSLRFPIFSAAVQLYANLDPLAPLAPARSFFAFNAADAGQSGPSAAPQVATNYSSTLGFAYSLLPQPGSALVFAVNRQASTPNSQDPYYLVPSGNFQLATAQQGHVNIMCGLSGVEYISPVSQPSATANMLTFYPGQAAFAPGFYPGEAPGYTQVVPQQMPTTSFVWIAQVTPQQNNPLSYFAQPDQSVLYNIDTADPNNINGLAPVAVLANTLPSAPPQGALFPMMPYGGLSGQDLGPFAQMETQAIGPARRLALAQTGNPTTPANPEQLTSTYSATPQGLLVQYSEGATTWPYVVLGQTQVQPPGQQLTTQLFQLSGVQGQLLTALETNKLFLVVSNPQVFSAFLESVNALISVGAPADAWTFNIDPALWTRSDASQSTIFILKFSDLSISDLAGEPSAWAFANTFNSSPSQVSAIIGQIIQNAAGEGSDFEQFLYAVNTPTWNGILVLNASAPLSALPPQLAGIGAGIDPSLFYAHHVGINASKIVVNTGQQLGIDNSSIFGLINYNGGPLQPSSNDYQFTVRTLRVLFLNSAVAGFSSTIDFQINSL